MENEKKNLTGGIILFLILLVMFSLCVTAQFLLAGFGTFVDPLNWARHVQFVHIFGFNLPVIMLIVAYFGKLPRWSIGQILAILFTMFLMYFTANITRTLPWIGALHPLIGAVLFGQSIIILVKTIRFTFKKEVE